MNFIMRSDNAISALESQYHEGKTIQSCGVIAIRQERCPQLSIRKSAAYAESVGIKFSRCGHLASQCRTRCEIVRHLNELVDSIGRGVAGPVSYMQMSPTFRRITMGLVLPLTPDRMRPVMPARCITLLLAALLAVSSTAVAQNTSRDRPTRPRPTIEDMSYGPHQQQKIDFYKADSDTSTPLVIYIHGGGFRGGSFKGISAATITQMHKAGISIASVEYRFVQHAPLPAAHNDCRRAIQTLRSQAKQLNIDPHRIAAYGGSAGAQLSMYLAFHDDAAEPQSKDPIARQSTRLIAVATSGGQTTMDLDWWTKNIPGYDQHHRDLSEYFGDISDRERSTVIHDISAIDLMSDDDPPIFMSYAMTPDDPVPDDPKKAQNWKIHHVKFGQALLAKAKKLGVDAHLRYRGAAVDYPGQDEFFIDKLK